MENVIRAIEFFFVNLKNYTPPTPLKRGVRSANNC